MNTSMRWLASLLLLTVACDSKSNEIGATVGDESSTSDGPVDTSATETTSGGDTSGGETTSGPVEGACEQAVGAEACMAVDFGPESLFQCAWIDAITTADATCSVDAELQSRCITVAYQGEGCLYSPCVDDTAVYRRDVGDELFEFFATDGLCEYQPVDFSQCTYDSPGESAPGCNCTCENLGGFIPGASCDPLGDPCPNAGDVPQECEPNAADDGWSCVPQHAGTSPDYGDDCWPKDQPLGACQGQNTCLPADGLGVADCDGGEGGGCCTMLCDLFDDVNPCPDPDQVCASYYGEGDAPAGYENVGVCRLP
jgi:hypothetical protein